MIHIFDDENSQAPPKFFFADDVSEHLADLLRESGCSSEDYSIDWQPPGGEYRSQFVITRRATNSRERDTRFRIAIQRADST